jgi:phosphomannomutase
MRLILFDVDGTLTPARKVIEEPMLEILQKLKLCPDLHIGFVGGSDLIKQKEQLGEENLDLFYWRFSENGLLGYKDNICIHKRSFVKALTDEKHFKQLINICLSVLSTLECPVKRGTFIEYRNSMINISPIGRACTQTEREEFEAYDYKHHIRKNMIYNIQNKWSQYITKGNLQNIPELQFSIGGQISVDVFPKGWDKTYCLDFIKDTYDEIHFFGDKTEKGGNDYEIYQDPRVIGHKVAKYQDTIEILNNLFLS